MASPRTTEALDEIKRAAATGQRWIVPAIFSHLYGRAATSAAFRMARAQGVVEVAYVSAMGTPVYQAAGVNAASIEAQTAVMH